MKRLSLASWLVIWTACGDSGTTSVSDSSTGSSTGAAETSTGPASTTSTTDDTPTGTGGATGTDTTNTPTTTGALTLTTGDETTGDPSTTSTTSGETTSADTTSETTSDATTSGTTTSDESTSTGEPLGPFDVESLEAGHGHVCAVLVSGGVKCWGGYSDSGDLGLGNTDPHGTAPNTMGDDLPFVDLGAGQVATAVGSYYHGCAVLDGGQLKCWGQGSYGALGSGAADNLGDEPGEMGDLLDTIDLGQGRTVQQVVTAVWTTCAVLDDDTAKCWGWNGNGWLGQGDGNDRGDAPGEMGDALQPIDLGAGRTVQSIGIDNSHACALLDDATVKCWGQQSDGNLGNGLPGLDKVGDAPGEMGDALKALDFGQGRTVKQLAVGARHGCVILDDDKIKCWGSAEYGQLGLGDQNHRGDAPGEMGDALPYVDLGAGRTALSVRASYFHSCAILDDLSLKCWGHGAFGATGQGDTNHRGDGPGEMGDDLPPIDLGAGRHAIAVAPGALYNCALLDNHRVKCWGIGGVQGALGYEDQEHRGDAPGEMGDNLPFIDLGGP